MDYVDVPLRVRYADTDQMGIVYYGAYPVYFEVARSEFMRHRGLSYRNLEELGYFLVVAGMEVKYYNPAVYDDLLFIRTSVSNIQSRGVTFEYLILRDSVTVVQGTTRHICVSSERKPRRLPHVLIESLQNGHSD
ncbi:MAG TPA: thioesterase family protein [Syntrophorhabdales bacterium]|nr:thioesterase family protein [Syntrophorhabdales bacterium]